jgi:hypothetical protein
MRIMRNILNYYYAAERGFDDLAFEVGRRARSCRVSVRQ